MMRHAKDAARLVLALALGLLSGGLSCGAESDDDPEGCTFRGRYELGGLPDPANPVLCPGFSTIIPGDGMQTYCATSESGVTATGLAYDVTLFCEPGDPVGECTGTRADATGCRQSIYLRRLSP